MLTFSRRTPTRVSIQMTSLIDMVFLLLIYFLLTSSFVSREGVDVQLPRVSSEFGAKEERLIVVVDKDGRFLLEERPLDEAGLLAALRNRLRGEPEPVIVNADRRVVYDRVMQAMDIAEQAGAKELLLATEPEQKAGKGR
ncbi:MAG: ExbD/TolR family protein [Thermodesulfobacteriota bacterium]